MAPHNVLLINRKHAEQEAIIKIAPKYMKFRPSKGHDVHTGKVGTVKRGGSLPQTGTIRLW